MNRTEANALLRIPVTTCRGQISNGALSAEDLPTRLKILNWGVNESTKGRIVLDAATAEKLEANQRALGFDRVAIDYEHGTVPGSPAYAEAAEPRPVAGYATPRLVAGDGLYLENITWTASGRSSAKNYADLSPAVRLDDQGRVLFLHSTALCRNGAIYDLSFYSTTQPQDPSPAMDITTLTAQLQTLSTSLAALDARLKSLEDRKPADITTLSVAAADGKITALSVADLVTRVAGLETKLVAAQTAAEAAEKATLVGRFAAEGKAPLGEDGKPLSADALQTFSAGELKRLLANTPATVPLTARGRTPASGRNDGLKGLERANASLAATLAI